MSCSGNQKTKQINMYNERRCSMRLNQSYLNWRISKQATGLTFVCGNSVGMSTQKKQVIWLSSGSTTSESPTWGLSEMGLTESISNQEVPPQLFCFTWTFIALFGLWASCGMSSNGLIGICNSLVIIALLSVIIVWPPKWTCNHGNFDIIIMVTVIIIIRLLVQYSTTTDH